jgi:sulfite exporter TauE/SafE
MVAWGFSMFLVALGARRQDPGLGSGAHRAIGSVMKRVADRPPALRALALGLVTTLLPCGFLHVFVATAAGTGSAARGALVMAVFWIGTVPVMAGLGVLAQRALGPWRTRLPLASATTLVVVGALTLAGKLQLGAANAGIDRVCH